MTTPTDLAQRLKDAMTLLSVHGFHNAVDNIACAMNRLESQAARIAELEREREALLTRIDSEVDATSEALLRIAELKSQLAVVHEHRIKTERKYNQRVTHGFSDGFTMQLQAEATLLTMVCRESAGKELAERLVSLESQLAAAQRLNAKLRDRLDRVMADWYSSKTISQQSESLAHSLLSEAMQTPN